MRWFGHFCVWESLSLCTCSRSHCALWNSLSGQSVSGSRWRWLVCYMVHVTDQTVTSCVQRSYGNVWHHMAVCGTRSCAAVYTTKVMFQETHLWGLITLACWYRTMVSKMLQFSHWFKLSFRVLVPPLSTPTPPMSEKNGVSVCAVIILCTPSPFAPHPLHDTPGKLKLRPYLVLHHLSEILPFYSPTCLPSTASIRLKLRQVMSFVSTILSSLPSPSRSRSSFLHPWTSEVPFLLFLQPLRQYLSLLLRVPTLPLTNKGLQ